MLIGGLQKTSLLDYPDKVAAIIFTAGCNFRCGFCYNSHLVTKIDNKKLLPEKEIFDFLSSRKNKLDAVVITGGEPTLHNDLPEFIKKIKELGLLIKLDTNGTNPNMLKKLINEKLVDYIAMDIKAPLPKYNKVVNVKVSPASIKKSIKLIMESGLPYEFRSTILPGLHSANDLIEMSQLIFGAEKYFLQKFIAADSLNDQDFRKFESFTDKQMKELAKLISLNVKFCEFRS
ncbi:anaerobic ribonucleoside-triphosphate reductase activating protein [Candidatus Kuenenbacteria bacterium]|nr:anaerobic ribonucleoside-triphosphate reductase activating protein [Candidatus Kuenenbacteria bacterium]